MSKLTAENCDWPKITLHKPSLKRPITGANRHLGCRFIKNTFGAAANAEDALAINRQDPSELVILDIGLPGAEPSYLDIHLQPHNSFSRQVEYDHTVLAYLYRGQAAWQTAFGQYDERSASICAPALIVLDEGNWVAVQSTGEAARFLLISGKPMHEPIVRYGPFVMNTQAEIEQTLKDLRDGTFGAT